MAHLLEHLAYKGTPNHPNLYHELNERGASFNANTWLDRTYYFETFPASEDNLAWALDVEAGPHGQCEHHRRRPRVPR